MTPRECQSCKNMSNFVLLSNNMTKILLAFLSPFSHSLSVSSPSLSNWQHPSRSPFVYAMMLTNLITLSRFSALHFSLSLSHFPTTHTSDILISLNPMTPLQCFDGQWCKPATKTKYWKGNREEKTKEIKVNFVNFADNGVRRAKFIKF